MDKTWGVVITSTGIAPNTGTHAWDVKIRKCDRGYMAIGVATRDVATSAHLGSDKYRYARGAVGSAVMFRS